MRFILAGLLLLFIPSLVSAQATGQVQSIGFNGYFRPNSWTPMLVRLTPQTAESGNYEIQVWQHDLDGDRPIYTRPIVLNGSAQASSQTFWIYFLPQPIEKGLPDGGSLRDLQHDLQVFLCTPSHKQIAQLPLTSTLQNVDPFRDNYTSRPRGSKLILAVSANGSTQKHPTLDHYDRAVGQMEDVEVVALHMNELPEDPIGYEAVDTIIWLDGNPADLATNNLDTLAAIKDYVRFGGHMVVCQSTANWQDDLGFGDMLPVDVLGVTSKPDFEPLASLAKPRLMRDPFHPAAADTWSRSQGPYLMAKSTARPGSVVEQWINWKPEGMPDVANLTPWLARKSYGLGEVTWVAQPLTTESAPSNPTAWPYIWDKVLGIKNDSYVLPDNASPDEHLNVKNFLEQYHPAGPTDLGYSLVQGLNLNSKANWLILLSILFFVVYWLISGPGTYAYLVAKKKQGLSWFLFGISAMVATGLTILVVKLVLRGPPEVKHISFVRVAPGQPAIVYSRFGLYIPRDGAQKLELEDTSPSSVSYLSPFAEHPQQLGADVTEFPSPAEYYVPVRDLKSDTAPLVNVDYRSSMKKFQARWVGDWQNRFTGSIRLDLADAKLPLAGTLTNGTGQDLNDIYLAFNIGEKDWMIYIPAWPKGATVDMKKDLIKPLRVGRDSASLGVPGDKKVLSDEIAPPSSKADPKLNGWMNCWYSHLHRSGSTPDDMNHSDSDFEVIFPLLTVYDRLPAMPKTPANNGGGGFNDDRVEFFNRGARMLNASSSIAAGQLVIIANSKGPLPIPLQVDDNKMTGDGTTFYQFILPLDRGKMDEPTTQPSEK